MEREIMAEAVCLIGLLPVLALGYYGLRNLGKKPLVLGPIEGPKFGRINIDEISGMKNPIIFDSFKHERAIHGLPISQHVREQVIFERERARRIEAELAKETPDLSFLRDEPRLCNSDSQYSYSDFIIGERLRAVTQDKSEE